MDRNDKFGSINDLYNRILPSLNTKVTELKREHITDITVKDIWNYCIQYKWINRKDLRIYEMVDDILNLDVLDLRLRFKK